MSVIAFLSRAGLTLLHSLMSLLVLSLLTPRMVIRVISMQAFNTVNAALPIPATRRKSLERWESV